jgi:hypothetical protein
MSAIRISAKAPRSAVAARFSSRPVTFTLALLVAGAALACSSDSPGPTALAGAAAVDAIVQASVGQGTHAYPLTAIVREGQGHVNITPEASQEGFSVEVQVSLRWTEPNADFLLTRSVDFVADGVCTGSTFTALPWPNPGPSNCSGPLPPVQARSMPLSPSRHRRRHRSKMASSSMSTGRSVPRTARRR